MDAFNDAVEKLLWPDKRLGKDSIWRTEKECNLQVQGEALPEPLRTLLKPHLDPDGYFRLGPIPAGTPVNLLANLNTNGDKAELVKLGLKIKSAYARIKLEKLDAAASKALLRDEVAPALYALSNCPDFIEDSGHLYGTDLPNDEKRALIEYLKTF